MAKITPEMQAETIEFMIGGTPPIYDEAGNLTKGATHTDVVELHNPTEEEVKPIREKFFEKLDTVEAKSEGTAEEQFIEKLTQCRIEMEIADNATRDLFFKGYSSQQIRIIKHKMNDYQKIEFNTMATETLNARLYFLSQAS